MTDRPRLEQRPTALYRFWNSDNTLLYVGITYRIESRLSQHRQEKPWDQIATVTVEHHPTRQAALLAEKTAVENERPKWNVVHNQERTTREARMSDDPTGALDGLVGHAFHVLEEKDCEKGCRIVEKQGHIVAQVNPELFMVEWFSWGWGEPCWRELVRIEDMIEWRFYDSIEWMREEWEYGGWKAASTFHWERCDGYVILGEMETAGVSS